MKRTTIIFIALICLIAGFNTNIYSQAARKVLLENWTSSTCGPCASNNPQLKQWVADHWENLTAVSYHVWWPAPGNDPMYLHNPSEVSSRVSYYSVNAVPAAYLMGIHNYVGSPFSFSNMTTYYNFYSGQTVPLGLTVVDTRIAGDSNRAVVTLTNYTNLPAGNYALRVMVVERWVIYQSPPGTNGETVFGNVFRKALPNAQGSPISMNAGTYTFEFRYKINAAWQDSSIYTMAFVQNDNDKTVMNTARNGMIFTGIDPISGEIPSSYRLSQNYPNPFNPTTNIDFNLPKDEFVTLKIYNILGKEVKTLVEGNHKAGIYHIAVDGTELASGIYFYTLRTSSFVDTKKMTLIK
ncbi:MAG TPA: Omp28-related outer membrane protein [Ignavibacteria bacterium]